MSTPQSQKELALVPPAGNSEQPNKTGDGTAAIPSFISMMGTEMVDINVGKGKAKTHYRIYKTILCTKIPYFDKMFNSGFKESAENKVDLPEDDPKSFDLLMLWTYNYPFPKYEWSTVMVDGVRTGGIWDAIEMYILAEKMCLTNLMDEVCSQYIDADILANLLPGPTLLGTFHKRLSDHMAFRKYAAYSLHYVLHGLAKNPATVRLWPVESLNPIMTAHPALALEYLQLVQQHPINTPVLDPRKLPRCTFHQHAADAPCSFKFTTSA
ncbi:hypothetical protein EG329_002514 [Mollisiaceae sp. DMI_Dod_QoI]|nr:hypothetical protein EG329_002514 [Helotiales sp. DMI_Dod_QoI]